MNILVVGKRGQLAQTLGSMSHQGIDIICLGRPKMDLTVPFLINQALEEISPDIVINAAAYTAVDQAESEQDSAYAINANGVKNLAQSCSQKGIKLVHISTDYVFDGDANTPYKETDQTKPSSVYGKSKLAGEQLAQAYCPDATIVRVSWLYSDYANHFVRTMLRLGETKEELDIVADQYGRPTYAKDLAEFLISSISQDILQQGIYHFTNTGRIASWHDFAMAIFARAEAHGLKTPSKVNAITSAEYPTPAARPHWSVLDLGKIEQEMQYSPQNWERALDLYFQSNYRPA